MQSVINIKGSIQSIKDEQKAFDSVASVINEDNKY